jgi:DNA-binding transcriptional regulator YiaG
VDRSLRLRIMRDITHYRRNSAFCTSADFCDMVKKPFTSAGTITAQQVRAARAWLNLSQDDLAATTLIARRAIQDFENGKREPQPRTLRDLRVALEQAGIEFLFIGEHAAGICKRDPD